jgi:putative ABC transport system permease protein
MMLFNYFKTARRNLVKHKTFSAINLLGLSFSMSVCLLIITLINDQLSYDQFHTHKENIYRVITDIENKDGRKDLFATTSMPIAKLLEEEYAGVKTAAAISNRSLGEVKFNEKRIPISGYFANQNFLKVFSFKLKKGDQYTALRDPYTVVLTEEMAYKIFGAEEALGKTIEIGNKGTYTVSGIMEKPAYKSHIKFDALCSGITMAALEKKEQLYPISDNWESAHMAYVYVLLEDGINPEQVASYFPEIENNHYEKGMEYKFHYQLQALSSITPGKFMQNQTVDAFPAEGLYILGALAIIIMFSACFNYTNLSISRALTRVKEVGIRKVSGATRFQVISQFLSEAVLFSFISLLIAIFIYRFLLEGFNNMNVAQLISLNLEENPTTYLWFFLFSILIGIVAGIFPALFLSSFKPISVLKNLSNLKLFSKLTLRKSLIVVQFSISLFFIITVITISKQSDIFIKTEYGFNSEHIINIPLKDAKAELFLNEILKRNDVIQASATSHLPASGRNHGTRIQRKIDDEKQQLYFFSVDQNYIDNLGLKLVAGRNFPDYAPNSNESHIILNQTAVASLGFENAIDAIGESVILEESDSSSLQVIGVVKDYHFQPLFMDIKIMALRFQPEKIKVANVKINTENMDQTIAGLKAEWTKLDKNHAFEYQFFDDEVKESYGFVQDVIGIIGIAAMLAIIVASLGLLGMAIYNAESRVKEIGIRKVMGAEISNIVVLLSKGFFLLILIAVVIATPLAYFVNSLWLQEIANRITIGPGILASSILILLTMGLITIGSQSMRAAFTNPANSLKDE